MRNTALELTLTQEMSARPFTGRGERVLAALLTRLLNWLAKIKVTVELIINVTVIVKIKVLINAVVRVKLMLMVILMVE